MTSRHTLLRSLPALLVGLLTAYACQDAVPIRELAPGHSPVLERWDDVFTGRRLELELPGPEFLRISQIVVGSQGHLYLPHGGGARTILELDRNGRLVNEIPFPDTAVSTIAIDADNNLFLFNPFDRWVTVLSTPDARIVRRFRISAWPAAMVVLQDGSLVTYSAAGESDRDVLDFARTRPIGGGRVFERFDREGRRVAAGNRVRDEALRIFHGRVHTGGIVQGPDGDLIGLHPAAFELVRLSQDLDVLELIRAPANDPWAQHPPALPPGLDPYDYGPAHEQWWDSFKHIGRLFSLTSDLLLITIWESKGMADVSNFVNVYRMDGELLAQGLRVPHDGRIIGAGRGAVYVVRNASMRDDGSREPVELYEYTLLSTVSTRWSDRS